MMPVSAEATIKSALGSIPPALLRRLGKIEYTLEPHLEDLSSRWAQTDKGIRVELATEDTTPHDSALELLTCLGQAIWESAGFEERRTWLHRLREEIESDVTGEIDEAALAEKRRILSSRLLAKSDRSLERYAAAAFAGTLAEYVHTLWHDVEIRAGVDYLPAVWLRRRFLLFRRWFPSETSRRSHGMHTSCRRAGARDADV
jgi:hypothetical protein